MPSDVHPNTDHPAHRDDWQAAYLEVYARIGREREACERVGVGHSTVWRERQRNEDFALAFNAAHARYVESLRKEIHRRAVEGWDEPQFYQGEVVGHVRRFDTALLIFETKRHDPAYRDSYRVEHTGPDGGPIQVQAPPDATERSRRAAALLADAGGLPDVEGDVVDEDPPANGNGHGTHG
jgi:hypothetical protein